MKNICLSGGNVVCGWSLHAIVCFVLVVAVSELSGVRVDNGVVEWTISSSLPEECYGNYSLQLSRCMIQDFAVLPALSLNGNAVRSIFAGDLLLMVNLFDFSVLIIIHIISPGVSAAMPPTNVVALYFASYESVDIGKCDRPTLRTSITLAKLSGSLVLSSVTTEASTSLCNISLRSEGWASTSSLVTSCSAAGEIMLV